jgi:hypothetical protein
MRVKKPVSLQNQLAKLVRDLMEIYECDENTAFILLYKCLGSMDVFDCMLYHVDNLYVENYISKLNIIPYGKRREK